MTPGYSTTPVSWVSPPSSSSGHEQTLHSKQTFKPVKSCRHPGHPPNSRPQRWSALGAASPLGTSLETKAHLPMASHGLYLPLARGRLQGQRVGPDPLRGRERMSCQHSPPHKSNHSLPPPKTEVGSSGILAAAHLPPLGTAASAPSAPPSPCSAGNPFAPALSALQGDK